MMMLPEDFEVDAPDRQARWDALPAAAKTYISQLQAQNSKQAKRISELEAVFNAAWGKRFCDAHEYKVALLKQVHASELNRLRDNWDSNCFRAGVSTGTYSLHRLNSVLLAEILRRSVAVCDVGQDPASADSDVVRKRCGDDGWHTRRALAQVCKLFEAFAYTLPSEDFFALDASEGDCAEFVCRDIERAALSSTLQKLALFLPPQGTGAVTASAAAAALRQCDALQELSLTLPALALDDEEGIYDIPAALLAALPSCKQLKTLTIHGRFFFADSGGGPSDQVMLSPGCAAELTDALAAMPALECLSLKHLDLKGTGIPARSLPEALCKCGSLSEFHASWLLLPCGWDAIVRLPLSTVSLNRCGFDDSSTADLALHTALTDLTLDALFCEPPSERRPQQLVDLLPGAERLRSLGWGFTVSPLVQDAFAAVLPCMKALQHVSFDACLKRAEDVERCLAFLPRCRQLQSLKIRNTAISRDEENGGVVEDAAARWFEALAAVVRSCKALTCLELWNLALAPLQEEQPLSLAPLWRVLPECSRLECAIFARMALQAHDAAVLCVALPRCPALKALYFAGCGLEQAGIDALLQAADQAGVDFTVM